ncbi:MAG: hypothetical protein VB013_00570 [Anaerolineaceae bacterium]|nr:hypothetical protein [Anaerolineaceae bacterium]
MKKIFTFLHFFSICLVVAAFIALYYFEDTIQMSQTGHDLIAIGLLILLFITILSWVDHNQTDFLVSRDTLEKYQKKESNTKKLEHE